MYREIGGLEVFENKVSKWSLVGTLAARSSCGGRYIRTISLNPLEVTLRHAVSTGISTLMLMLMFGC